MLNLTKDKVAITEETLAEWQGILDVLAGILHIPAALIMRLVGEEISVFCSSKSNGNPYNVGDSEHFWDSGLYCETVVRSHKDLLVPNALKDPDWANNPDVKLNMISYLGCPLTWPDKEEFGTICVLDNKENAYDKNIRLLLHTMQGIIQTHLSLVYMNHQMGTENRRLTDLVEELTELKDIVPVCWQCQKIRNDEEFKQNVDGYIGKYEGTGTSRGLCPTCKDKHYDEYKIFGNIRH